jgi:membrane protease YdiL (CAAX protease family)
MKGGSWMLITFGLLGLSICSAWLPSFQVRKQIVVAPWLLLVLGAGIAGLQAGYLTWPAVIELCGLGTVAYFFGRTETSRALRIVFGAVTAVWALALAMHRLPGFNNPVLIANVKFSRDAVPFTLYANFDKAAVGLILLVFLCNRAKSASDWKNLIRRTAPVALITTAFTIAAAIALGNIRPDLKYSQWTPVFLVVNLLFTCVAEEAFFRGFLQEQLAKALDRVRYGELLAIASSGLLFGLAHATGGSRYMMLATLSGLGCATAYSITRRVEAPIITHFMLNAVHFIGFTYPQLL